MDLKKLVKDIGAIQGVEGVYLFGSAARGKARPYSDTDICVITKPGISEKARTNILLNAGRKVDISILDELPIYIRFRVFKEGRPLLVKNRLAVHRAKTATIREYQNFSPLLQKHYSKILGGR